MHKIRTNQMIAAVTLFRSILGIVILAMNAAATAQDFWMETESPRGGFVNQLAINFQDHVYAAVNSGGLYRTLNHGDSWSKIVDPFGDKNILSVAVDAAGDVYVSTYWWEGGMLRS